MRIDYEAICALAAEIGCRRDDLIALSPGNDPFYADLPSRREAGEWFAGLWTQLNFQIGSHPRRLHYNVISQPQGILKPNGSPYFNTINDWKYLGISSLAARYLRLIPDGALSDHRNDAPIINSVSQTLDIPSCYVNRAQGAGMKYDIPNGIILTPWVHPGQLRVPQPFLVEIWVEKSTQNDILIPLSRRLGINLVPGTGETSEVLARQAVARAMEDGRPMRILYVSDFDPGGRSMPVGLARKIEFWIRQSEINIDVTLEPIVLTPEQCETYRLPRTPLKETEKRAFKFEQRFGAGATELDALEALHPGELARIVEEKVLRYFDPSLTSRVSAVNSDFMRLVGRAQIDVLDQYDISGIEKRYGDLIEKFKEGVQALEADTQTIWREIADDLEEDMPTFDPDDVPAPRPATPPEAPLFDSQRDYVDQIDHYHRWQGRGAG